MIRKGLVGGQYQPLTPESIARIDETVLKIIEEIGWEIHSQNAIDALEKAGATVDSDKRRVRLSRQRVRELIGLTPSEIVLCGRDEKHDIHLGGKRVYAGTGGTALNVYEPATGATGRPR
jgi:trimethylamine--corrinoid protein Co-methyltransferase